jgi:hypothetical protein
MSNATIAKPQIHVKAIVRDKHGNPKFDNPEKVRLFLDQLSDEDIKYLEEQFNDNFRT